MSTAVETATPKRVFITGASGFVGRALGDHYRQLGTEVCGVDVTADPDNGVVAGDIAEPGAWQAAARGSDVVIHTAAIVSFAVDYLTAWRTNVAGTCNVIDAAAGAEARLLHFSSIVVFPDVATSEPINEHHPLSTDGRPYVDTKVCAEQAVLQAFGEGRLPVTIVRPGDLYGPGSRAWTILPVEFMRARKFVLPANGRGAFSPIYIDDLVEGARLAAGHPAAVGQVFTLTGGVSVTLDEFFGYYARMLGRRSPIALPTKAVMSLTTLMAFGERLRGKRSESNPAAVKHLIRETRYSIDKARSVLGYEPKYSLEEGMRKTEAWLRDSGYLN